MPMVNPYITEDHFNRAFPEQKGSRVVVEASALESLKAMAQRLQQERDLLGSALAGIISLDPEFDSDEGCNEWGEADCFRQAKELAKDALAKCTQEQPISDWQERMK